MLFLQKKLVDSLALIPGNFYHIYNRGNNGQDIFFENENYIFFLNRYDRYISPFCETIAWVLLKNHFHILIYVKDYEDFNMNNLEYSTVKSPKRIDLHLQFGHFFNSYAKAINKRYKRTGSLFEKKFERKIVNSDTYLQNLIHYIHYNPLKHRFTENIWDYPWSSYESVLSSKPTKLKREFVLNLFKNKKAFEEEHQKEKNYIDIEDLIIEY